MSDFIDFARGYGLILEYALADNVWHRTKTEDKPRKKNGAYVYDGERGVVINFATMNNGAVWRSGARAGYIDRSAIRAQRAIQAAQERARQTEARHRAEDMLKRAALDVHPYLAAKGFPQEKGFVLDGDLLIPMREFSRYSQVNSLQRIAANGSKLFLPGGKAKGSAFIIGPFMAQERWLVEGYATGLSVLAATHELHRKAQVVVCFSAGNLAQIGRLAKAMRPQSYVFADNDESGAGAKAAAETGLSFVMTTERGDANDYHARHGVRALATLIRQATAVRRQEEAA